MVTHQPFFSIIVPSFNSEKTISGCIDSVLGQSFADLEIIVIDGVSKDKTLSILAGYQTQSSKIKVFSEPDQGIYDAMNKGIKLASGKWLYFLGTDDYFYSSEVLKDLYAYIQANPKIDILYANVWSDRFNGCYGKKFTPDDIIDKNICHQAILFSKQIFSVIGNFDLQYRAHADWDHNLKWFLSPSVSHLYVPVTVAHYADGGFSSTSADRKFNDEKRWNFLKYSKGFLPPSIRLNVLIVELAKSIKRFDFPRLKRALKAF